MTCPSCSTVNAENARFCVEWGGNLETKYIATAAESAVALAEGRLDVVLADGTAEIGEIIEALGPLHESLRQLWPDTLQAAIAEGRLDVAEELVEIPTLEPPGCVSPYLRGELNRGRGLLAAARDEHDDVEEPLRAAVATFDWLGYPFPRARAQVDLAEWLIAHGRYAEAEPLLSEAVIALSPLRAATLLARANDLLTRVPASAA